MSNACLALLFLSACTFHQRAVELPAVADGGSTSGQGPSAGADAIARRHCAACHDRGDGSFSGQAGAPQPGSQAYAPNLTPDQQTGLGGWSDAEIVRALRDGVDDDAVTLCPPMPRFSDLGDAEAAAIVLFLRALPPVSNKVPESVCSPLKAGGDRGGEVDASLAPPDLAIAQTSGCAPVINELAVAGPAGATDEFIELYNPCTGDYPLDGHRLVYRSAGGKADTTLVSWSSIAIAPQAHLVVANAGYRGPAAFRYAGGLAASGGAIALYSGSGEIIDAVAYGDAHNDLVRGTPAPTPPAGRSIGRHPDGAAPSTDAASDFGIGAPTPGAPNG